VDCGTSVAMVMPMNIRIDSSRLTPAADVPAGVGWQACLSLGFEARDGRTVLARREHRGPLRVQRALYPEGERICHVILLHPPAGIAGGDELRIDVQVGEGGHALLTTPGAGKWYRSAGATGRLTQTIAVASGAVCEWLPQESIAFDGALGESRLEVELAGNGVFIGSEILCFGRTASGERFGRGRLGLQTRIRRDGRAVWLERGQVTGGGSQMDARVALGGAPVSGTLLVAAPGIAPALRDACREVPVAVGEGALTLLPDLLVARYLGPGAEPARQWFAALWARLRPAVAGSEARIPRIWNT